MITTFTWS